METITKDYAASNSLENSNKTINSAQKFKVAQRNPWSNSWQHNECEIYNKNKSGQGVGAKCSADESLLCLKRCGKIASQEKSLPKITRERSDEREHCQPNGQCLVGKMTSIKHVKAARAATQFCWYQCKTALHKTRILLNTWKMTREKNLFVARSVEKNFPLPADFPTTCEHNLEKNPTVSRSVVNDFHRWYTWTFTCEHTLEKNHIVARSVENDFPKPAAWPRTCEHTLETNLFVATTVEEDFPLPATWPTTCEHTLEKKHIVARSVENDFPLSAVLPSTCEHTLEKNYIVARFVKNDLHLASTWPRTWEHTLEKNHIVARSVEKDFPLPATWPPTFEHTLEINRIVVRSVEKCFTAWWHQKIWPKEIKVCLAMVYP